LLIVDKELDEWEENTKLGRIRKWFNLDEAKYELEKHKPIQGAYLNLLKGFERSNYLRTAPTINSNSQIIFPLNITTTTATINITTNTITNGNLLGLNDKNDTNNDTDDTINVIESNSKLEHLAVSSVLSANDDRLLINNVNHHLNNHFTSRKNNNENNI
jgi:hypothetical protein